jgi:hypothetical protein
MRLKLDSPFCVAMRGRNSQSLSPITRRSGLSCLSLDYLTRQRPKRLICGRRRIRRCMRMILATVAHRYCLRLAPGARVEVEPAAVLRPRGGLPMMPHFRS